MRGAIMVCYVFDKEIFANKLDKYLSNEYEGICMCKIPIEKTIEDGKSFIVKYNISYDAASGKVVIEYDDEGGDVLPPVINDCKSCGYSAPMGDKLYVDKFTHPLVYCRHHEVICVADRKPCEWAMRGEKKSP